MSSGWDGVLDFTYLSLFLAAAVLLKSKFKILQKYMIPTSIIAGFIGLVLGPEVLRITNFNANRLGDMIYHLMAVGFIAMALKNRTRQKGRDAFDTGAIIVATYVVQGIVGFALSLLLVYMVYPKLFPAFGLLLPLGYGQGPGQSYSIGSQWEALGFDQGGNIGLTIAAFGFLWACIGGVPLLNYLLKVEKMKPSRFVTSFSEAAAAKEDKGDTSSADSIDRITVQVFYIGIIYLLTYLTLNGISLVLAPFGIFGETLSKLFWGFHFIIATVFALLFRSVLNNLTRKGILNKPYTDDYLLEKISGGSFDYMIAASIATISILTFKNYIVPILLITTIGGVVSVFFVVYICKKVYKDYVLEYILALYGMLTGTISTGLALLREVDTNYDSPAAENLVFGSSVGLVLGLPLMILLNIPVVGYVTNRPVMYLYTFAALSVYMIVLLVLLLTRKRS